MSRGKNGANRKVSENAKMKQLGEHGSGPARLPGLDDVDNKSPVF